MVCFDLGGVIIRHHRSWKEACAALAVEYHAEIEDPALVARRRAITREFQQGRIGSSDFYRRVSAATDHRYAPEEVRVLHDAWIYAEYEGIDRVLRRLVGAGRADTGVLSNTNAEHWRRICPIASGGRPEFASASVLGHLHASQLLGLVKPDPAIYRAYEDRTGVFGDAVLFFDDLPENVDAARAIGWRAELIDHAGNTALQVERALERYGVV